MKKIAIFFVIIVGLLIPLQSFSQSTNGTDSRGVNYSFYPILGYSSDIGFFGGGLFQRIDYGDGIRPFFTNTVADFTGSTNGKWDGSFEHERTRLLGKPLRSRMTLTAVRNPISNYFGIGNNTGFSSSGFDEGMFYLLQKRIVSRFELRKPLHEIYNRKPLEAVFRIKVSYTDNEDLGADTRFVQSPPTGAASGWVNTVGTGLIYDTRNSEFDPRYGIRAEAGVDFSPVAAGNDFGFSSYFTQIKAFVPIFDYTVLAQQVAAEHTYGSVPYFELPALGNQYGLRGYAMDRFLGDSSVLYMAEIRSWILRFFDDQLKFGGHLFFDTGRVFSEADSSGFFSNWKQTWGLGGAMSVFNQDLIFRGELGFSNETQRIYVGIGYSF